MENIWGFLLQTLSVSLVLLLLKRIFEDKLSPRWQYGIWSLLALRILLPVSTARDILLPLPFWVERWKTWVEGMLTSSYADVYQPVRLPHILPMWSGAPVSVTDGLFLVYGIGVVLSLLWYAGSYLRLRTLLQKGSPVDEKGNAQIQSVAREYKLKCCPTVELHGLSSAFICGVLQPILVIPAGHELDDKVVLHELLHLKYGDSLQSIFWCALRSLHWCNPFLQYVFYRIRCDMESLCDQRVLERLEGEARREYGVILLNMANEKYASMPGTTSISNGGKNISRRIAAIVRFKKYPKGMALVSVCIGIILLNPLFIGTKPTYGAERYHPGSASELEDALAMSRLNRCTTVAGAVDTYVKGLMFENGIYIAMASPMDEQEALAQKLRLSYENEGWGAYYMDSGWELEQLDVKQGYRIYNLLEREDGSYEAMVALAVDYFAGTASEEAWREETKQSHMTYPITLLIPVRIAPEGDAWVVEEVGDRIQSDRDYPAERYYADGALSHLAYDRQVGQTGILTMSTRMEYYIENWSQADSVVPFFNVTSFDQTPKTDAEFSYAWELRNMEYECTVEGSLRDSLEVVAMYSAPAYQEDVWPEGKNMGLTDTWASMSSTTGLARVKKPVSQDWDGRIVDTNSQYVMGDELESWEVVPYEVRIYWNGEVVDTFIMQEERDDGTE